MKESSRKWPLPRRVPRSEVVDLFETYHAYAGVGAVAAFWAAGDPAQAAWAWTPAAPGAARKMCPECPSLVLGLARMVATPRVGRDWHISKPLKWVMKRGIDRTRWPVLVTYADTGVGHSGHVYRVSGWVEDGRVSRPYYEVGGVRVSPYRDGRMRTDLRRPAGKTELIRFVNRACPPGEERAFAAAGGWTQVDTGKTWRNGSPRRKWIND